MTIYTIGAISPQYRNDIDTIGTIVSYNDYTQCMDTIGTILPQYSNDIGTIGKL